MGVVTDDVLLRALILRTQSIDGFPFVESCLRSSTPSKDSADALPHWKTVRVGIVVRDASSQQCLSKNERK